MIIKNKKAQVGETMTWIIATLVIIGTLLIFIYASVALANFKSVGSGEIKNKVKENLNVEDVNWIEAKNQFAFSKNSANKLEIQEWINATQKN